MTHIAVGEKLLLRHCIKAAIFFLFHKASQSGWKLMLVFQLSMNSRFEDFRKREGRKEEAQPNTSLRTTTAADPRFVGSRANT